MLARNMDSIPHGGTCGDEMITSYVNPEAELAKRLEAIEARLERSEAEVKDLRLFIFDVIDSLSFEQRRHIAKRRWAKGVAERLHRRP